MSRTIRTKHKNIILLSTGREEQDKDLVKVTTSVLTLFDERAGSGGNDIDSTTSLSEGRMGSITDETELITWSTSRELRDNLPSLVGIIY